MSEERRLERRQRAPRLPVVGRRTQRLGAVGALQAQRSFGISLYEYIFSFAVGTVGWNGAIPVIIGLLFLGSLATNRQQKLAVWTLLWASMAPLACGVVFAGLKWP